MFGRKRKVKAKSEAANRQAEQELNEEDIFESEKKKAFYEDEKKAAHDDLDLSKGRVEQLKKELIRKKGEFNRATGATKEIVAGEYKLTSDELKRAKRVPAIILQRISYYNSLISAAEETIALKRGGSVRLDAGQIGSLREEGMRTLKCDADAIAELEESTTGATVDETFDVEKDFAELMESSLGDLELDESPLRESSEKRRIDPLEE